MTMRSVMPFCNPFCSRPPAQYLHKAEWEWIDSQIQFVACSNSKPRWWSLKLPRQCFSPLPMPLRTRMSWGFGFGQSMVFVGLHLALCALAMGTVELDVQTEAWHHPAPEWSCSDGHAHGALRLSGLETAGISWAWKNDVLVFGLQMLAFGVNSATSEWYPMSPKEINAIQPRPQVGELPNGGKAKAQSIQLKNFNASKDWKKSWWKLKWI